MKPSEHADPDQNLNSVLREWKVDAPMPPRFREQVWRRIGDLEAPGRPRFLAGLFRLVELALPRPKVAVLFLAGLLVLGVMAGSVTAQIESDHLKAALGASYLQSIDPYYPGTVTP